MSAERVSQLAVDITLTGLPQTQQGLQKVEDRGQKVQSTFAALRPSIVGIGAAFTGATVAFTQFIANADRFTNIAGRLRAATGDAQAAAQAQTALFQVAQRTGAEFASVVPLFSRVAMFSDQIGASQAEVLRFAEAVQKSFVLSGASSQEAASTAVQIAQALGSGRLAGDELRSLLENNVVLAKAIADGFGVSVGQLREMGKEGELLARPVLDSVLKAATSIDEKFEQFGGTVERSSQRIENALSGAFARIDQRLGASRFLSRFLDGIAFAIDTDGIGGGVAAALGAPWYREAAQRRGTIAPLGAPGAGGFGGAFGATGSIMDALAAGSFGFSSQFTAAPRGGAIADALGRPASRGGRSGGGMASTIAGRAPLGGGVRGVSSTVPTFSGRSTIFGNAEGGSALDLITAGFDPSGALGRAVATAEGIGMSIVDGISNGIATGVATGSIAEGFRALGGSLLGGMGRMLIDFGIQSLKISSLMQSFVSSLANLFPGGGIVASLGMIALGSTMVGLGQRAARRSFGGRSIGVTNAGGISPLSTGFTPLSSGIVSRASIGVPAGAVADGRVSTGTPGALSAMPLAGATINVFSPDDAVTQRFFAEVNDRLSRRGG